MPPSPSLRSILYRLSSVWPTRFACAGAGFGSPRLAAVVGRAPLTAGGLAFGELAAFELAAFEAGAPAFAGALVGTSFVPSFVQNFESAGYVVPHDGQR